MKITKKELIEMGACSNGLKRFITQTSNTDEPVEVSSLVGGENYYSDLLWLAIKKLPKERIVRFVCDCALLNIELIKPHTNNYDQIVEFLRNPTIDDSVCSYVWDAYANAVEADYAASSATAARSVYAATNVAKAVTYTDYFDAAYTAVVSTSAGVGADEIADKLNEMLKELFA